MRATWIVWVLVLVGPLSLWAELDAGAALSASKDGRAEERLVLLAAKVQKMAEIQDLLAQQQQLILQQMQELRSELERAKRADMQTVSEEQFQEGLAGIERCQKQLQSAQQTNWQSVCALVEDAIAIRGASPGPTNSSTGVRVEAYRVQSGDTVLKIVARANEAMEKNRLPRVTREEIEKVNPGLKADKIRVGQLLWLPVAMVP